MAFSYDHRNRAQRPAIDYEAARRSANKNTKDEWLQSFIYFYQLTVCVESKMGFCSQLSADLDNGEKRAFVVAQAAGGFPIIAGGLFVSGAMLKIANIVAEEVPTSASETLAVQLKLPENASAPWWCTTPSPNDPLLYNCSIHESVSCKVYDAFTPESVIAFAAMIEAVVSIIANPILGAYSDRTSHRRSIFGIVMLVQAATMGFQSLLRPSLLMLCIYLGVAEVVTTTLTGSLSASYLAECCKSEKDRMAVSAWASGLFYGTQVFTIIAFTVMGEVLSFDYLEKSQMGSIGAASGIAMCGYYSWRNFGDRPPTKAVSAGKYPFCGAFASIASTCKNLFVKYPSCLTVLVAYSFYMSSVTTLVAVATTYLSERVEMDISVISLVFLTALLAGIPGSLSLKPLHKRFSCKRIIIVVTIGWMITLLLFSVVLSATMPERELSESENVIFAETVNWGKSPEFCSDKKEITENLYALLSARNASFSTMESIAELTDKPQYTRPANLLVLVFGLIFGLGFSTGFTTYRVLFIETMPKARSAEMMGIFQLANRLLSWIPPLVFASMNEITSNKHGEPDLDLSLQSALQPFWGLSLLVILTFNRAKSRSELEASGGGSDSAKVAPAER